MMWGMTLACALWMPLAWYPLASATPAALEAWVAPATERVMTDAQPPADAVSVLVSESLTSGTPLAQSIAMARDETESFQLVLRAPVDVSNVTVELSGGPPGVLMHFWQVGYHHIPAIKPNPQGGPGLWPDVLLDARSPVLLGGMAQPIWIDVATLPSVAAGNYSEPKVVVRCGEFSVTVHIALRVFNFTLPRPLALRNQFFLNPDKLAKVYGGGANSPMVQKWRRELMHSYRVNPYVSGSLPMLRDLPGNGSTGTKVDIPALRQLIAAGMSSYTLPSLWLEGGLGFNETLLDSQAAAQLKPVVQQLAAAGLLQPYARVYAFDEDPAAQHAGLWSGLSPAQQANASAEYLSAGNLTRTFHWIRKTFPQVTTSTTQCQPGTPETPVNASALPGVLDTLAIDELALHSGVFSYSYQRALVAARKPPWLYTSWQPEPAGLNSSSCSGVCGTNLRFGNFLVDARVLLGWQTWSAEAAGFLYWGIAEWGPSSTGGVPIDADALPNSTAVGDWGLTSRQGDSDPIVGDGILAYAGVNGMLPSIRLANIRDGLEDNEYLVQLAAQPGWSRERVSEAFANQVSSAQTAHPTYSMMTGARTESPEVVKAARMAVAEALELSISQRE